MIFYYPSAVRSSKVRFDHSTLAFFLLLTNLFISSQSSTLVQLVTLLTRPYTYMYTTHNTIVMHRSTRNFNIPLPGKPWAFELLKTGSFKFPSPRAKIVFKCPTLSSDLSVCPQRLGTFLVNQSLRNDVSFPLNSSFSSKHLFYGC